MSTVSETIAANLRLYRKILGLTQEELAEKIGYTNQTISRAENGKGEVSLDLLIAFSQFANVSLDAMCGFNKPSIAVNGLTETQIAQLEQLAREMRKLNK